MERINVFFLHGFLGNPIDWSMVQMAMPREDHVRFITPDYFKTDLLNPQQPFDRWAMNFNNWVREQSVLGSQNILVAYSLGGRLALHALQQSSELWKRVVLVSTNPGFKDDERDFKLSPDREKRWLNDTYWAEQFLIAPWETVLRNWNSQAVFGHSSTEPERNEKNYSREMLGLALTNWSLAQQENLRPVIRKFTSKLMWIVGEDDEKFMDLSEDLKNEIPELDFQTIPECSHRVLFDKPEILAQKITQFARSLMK